MTRKNRRQLPLPLLLILTVCASVLPAADLSFTGVSQTKAAGEFEGGTIPYYEQKVDMRIDIYRDMSHLFFQPYISVSDGEDLRLGIRELYADFYLDTMDIRIGKQIIATGQADGLILTDMITPLNMSDFLLTEVHELHQGIPAVKADYYYDAFTFTGIWLPRFIPTETFTQDSYWYNSPSLFTQGTVTVNTPQVPGFSFENSELFAKAGYFGSAANIELLGGYTWTDEPYPSKVTVISPSPLAVEVDTAYGRYGVVGTSLSAPVSSAVLRGDVLVSLKKPLASVSTAGSPSISVEKHTVIDGLIGIDIDLAGFFLSAQYRGTFIADYDDALIMNGREADEFSSMATFRIQKSFLDDTLTAQIFSAMELNRLNALIRPSLAYTVEDAVEIVAEALLFIGDEEGLYGSYADRSLLSLALNYYF